MTIIPPKMEPTTREEYEAECREQGFKVLTDDDLSWLAERYSFAAAGTAYTNLSAMEKAELGLKLSRGHTINDERRRREAPYLYGETTPVAEPKPVSSRSHKVPEMRGQLWEDCERCGREPVYQPLFLCERCWPKAA
ncbi:hypothetical protein HFC70_20040 [Agrobacterium sp. a22-2]|uniref:hypothetical protein n=1 Tax=Agrobacterium TaxID=357 RepID=UPI00130098F3|nr:MULTISPECIES: hypothetical protein [Agrobacterium]NKN38645.1 hypothetical protein [Agrobacterium sp. a22-2]